MAIYLDANVIWSWRTFTEPDRLALTIVARQLGQKVYVPWIAAREAEEDYYRRLDDALDKMDKALADVEVLFKTEVRAEAEPWPDSFDALRTWRRRLEELATILPLHTADAQEAFEREISGTPPAKPREPRKPGRGGRDAAIWLTVARHHLKGSEDGHFISIDGDMAAADGQLHGAMRKDIESSSHDIQMYKSIGAFLARLGETETGREVTVEELTDLTRAPIAAWLVNSIEVPKAVWDVLEPGLRYSTVVTKARPVEIMQQRRYVQGDDAVIAINSRWELEVECCYQERDSQDPTWLAAQGVNVSADVQLFVEERGGELEQAQVIGVQITSEVTLFFAADGSVTSIGPA
jgi:hypothetical protein